MDDSTERTEFRHDEKHTYWSKDGVPCYRIPLPHRLHRCWVQSRTTLRLEDGTMFTTEHCPCGSIRLTGKRRWQGKNSRRRAERALH